MNLLLDTHVILWWYENPRLIRKEALKVIENVNNEIFVSAVVFWEIAIKPALCIRVLKWGDKGIYLGEYSV